MDALVDLVVRAQAGNLEAFGQLVAATQRMTYAVAKQVLREPQLAEDAAQEAYLRAFRRLAELEQPAGFIGWLRRIAVTTACNMRRGRRVTFLQLDDSLVAPILDEAETSWSDTQRHRLARALLTLTPAERQLCDRKYHGHWSTARLAREAGVDEATIRKRLQRVRDKLRKEIEVSEQHGIHPDEIRADFPATIVELLTRPRLTDLPENPVGATLDVLRGAFADCTPTELPEIIDFAAARATIGDRALYIEEQELHRVDDRRILRYDLTLPLLMTVRYTGQPVRVFSAGKTYRLGPVDALHLEAFHQAEVFYLDAKPHLDPWAMTGRVLQAMDTLLPGRTVKIVPTEYAMCRQAWQLEIEDAGRSIEALAWGVFTDEIVRHVGGDPRTHTAIGVGFGLERLAMLRYGIDDVRRIEVSRVA